MVRSRPTRTALGAATRKPARRPVRDAAHVNAHACRPSFLRPRPWRPVGGGSRLGRPRRPGVAATAFVAALLAIHACDELGRRGLVATAGDWTLSEDRLAELLVLAQPFPLDSAPALALVRHWQGAASLAARFAAGDSLLGSEALAASSWLDRREALLAADREARLGAQARLSGPAAVDSVFHEGSLRLVAQVLRRVGSASSSAEQVLQRRTAERIVQALIDGGSWTDAVAESEDVDSRGASGLLGLVARGELPSGLDRAAFGLEPGQISGVVQSGAGYHVLYRPRLEEVRRLFADRLRERRLAAADAEAGERAREERAMTVARGAEEAMARIAARPIDWLDSELAMVEWEGGTLVAGVVARYVLFLSSAARAELASAEGRAQADLVGELAVRELRLADLRARGVSLESALEEAMAAAHADEMEYWTRALELDAPPAPARGALARHMETLVARRGQSRSLSPLLETWLMARASAELRERGVQAAIAKARRMLEDAGK